MLPEASRMKMRFASEPSEARHASEAQASARNARTKH